jgi:hypothetical protein
MAVNKVEVEVEVEVEVHINHLLNTEVLFPENATSD